MWVYLRSFLATSWTKLGALSLDSRARASLSFRASGYLGFFISSSSLIWAFRISWSRLLSLELNNEPSSNLKQISKLCSYFEPEWNVPKACQLMNFCDNKALVPSIGLNHCKPYIWLGFRAQSRAGSSPNFPASKLTFSSFLHQTSDWWMGWQLAHIWFLICLLFTLTHNRSCYG